MCGITGFVGEGNNEDLIRMTSVLSHRGPDGLGTHSNGKVFLGHRRLSIIDRDGGQQPMSNEDENIWITYNGEIYNHELIRADAESKGHIFKTRSDTEAILHAFEEYDNTTFKMLNGMFAFAIWDEKKARLTLVRDQFGIKPLYYAIRRETIIFASEIKAILEHPLVKAEIDEESMKEYLFYRYIPNEKTMFKGICKLLQGEILVWEEGKCRIEKYHNLWGHADLKAQHNFSESNLVNRFRSAMDISVKQQLMGEVPIGIYLSGGLDSSVVCALVKQHLPGSLHTFSVAFDIRAESELPFARQVAEYLGTEHHEVIVKEAEVLKEIEKIVWHYDEPPGDAAVVPTYFVAREAKKQVTIVLAGEGADEQFAGYRKYEFIANLVNQNPGISPRDLTNEYCNEICLCSTEILQKLLKGFNKESFESKTQAFLQPQFEKPNHDVINHMMFFDQHTMLSENYLMKADKMSMAFGIEERVPYLDINIVRLTASVPQNLKIKGLLNKNKEKYLLKKSMSNILPLEIINRKKEGYGTPTALWFRSKTADVFEQRIGVSKLFEKYFNVDFIIHMLEEHRKGRANYNRELWVLYVLDIWYDINFSGRDKKLKEIL